jgi:hypothetical protein
LLKGGAGESCCSSHFSTDETRSDPKIKDALGRTAADLAKAFDKTAALAALGEAAGEKDLAFLEKYGGNRTVPPAPSS